MLEYTCIHTCAVLKYFVSLYNYFAFFSGEGRSEPVPIEIRAGRSGLGRDTELKRRADSYSAARAEALKKRQKMETERKRTFVARMSERFGDQQIGNDLYKSQKVCFQLDQQQVQICSAGDHLY